MPELAEVEIVRRNLESWWTRPASDVCLYDPTLLQRGSEAALTGLLCSGLPDVERRGKYLVFRFAGDRAVVAHFRMTGKIVRSPTPDTRFARLAWDAATDGDWLVFKDPRRLGHVEVFEAGELAEHPPLKKLGPEPLGLVASELEARLSPRRRLKDALLDQKVVAGVGNIAISEVFWRLKLAPRTRVAELDGGAVAELAAELHRYFEQLIDLQSGDEVAYIGEGGEVDNPFDVYDREGEACPRCGGEIAREVVAGRSSYFCTTCQQSPG